MKKFLKIIFVAWILIFSNIVHAANFDEVTEISREIAKDYYDHGLETALKYKELTNYSDHGINHAELVAVKSQAAAEAIDLAIKNNPSTRYYSEINKIELQIAAFMHDTGMDGGKFKEYNNGNALRKDHSLNSAIHVLENRKEIEKLGVNVDAVAVDCMAHSKSCSGVRDLTSAEQWTDCFDRIDAAVKLYNEKFPDQKIYFDKSTWTDGIKIKTSSEKDKMKLVEVYNFNRKFLSQTSSLVAALRLGDANREAAEYPFTQSGAHIEVDFDSYVADAETWKDEIKNADVILIDINGNADDLKNSSNDIEGYARMYSTGEGNLSMNCIYNPKTKAIQEQFKIHHAMSFPLSTQKCIEERLEELDTIKKFPVEAEIVIDIKNLTSNERRKIKKIYRNYCKSAKNNHKYLVKLKIEK